METPESPSPAPRDDDEPALNSIDHPICDLCGSEMIEWHCRIVCTACGYQRDCSDP